MNPHIQTLDAEVAVNGKQLLGGENGNNGGNVFDLVRDLVYAPQAWQTAEALVKTEAYHVNMALHPDDWFTWRSGIKAPCYCDCRHLNAHAEARVQITEALTEAVRHTFPNASLVVGMAAAGISWARGVADSLRLPLAYVRSSAKNHGVGGMVECSPPVGAKAVLIDDLAASGDSLKTAMQVLADEAQIQTVGIQTIVNWGFPAMRKNLAGTPVKALTSFPYILTHALAQSRISDNDMVELMAFYQNPKTHVWSRMTKH